MTDPNPDILYALYHSGAYLCLAIVAAYLALKYASNHVAWLEVPGRAHYVTALLAGAAVVIVPATQGTTPNASMLFAAGGTTLALLLPGVFAGSSSTSKTDQAGFARVGLMLVIAVIGVSLIACAADQRRQTLRVSVAALDTARTTLDTYEHVHTEQLIASGSGAQLIADVNTWRAKVDKVNADIDAAYVVAARAGAVLDDPSLATLTATLTALHTELVTLGVMK